MNAEDESKKTDISQATSFEEVSDYWDAHALTDHWEQTEEAKAAAEKATRDLFDAKQDAALADQGCVFVLDGFVIRLISQGKLVELFPGWRTCGHSFFTVTPKPCTPAPS